MDFDQKTFLLGVGAQKAGTTWLHDYFAERGDIYLPRKEIHFFDVRYGPHAERRKGRLVQRTQTRRRRNALRDLKAKGDCDDYKAFFESSVPDAIEVFGEITPSYALVGAEGYSEIRRLFRNVRIIFVMRDPVDRFYSHVRMKNNRRGKQGHVERDPAEFLDDPALVDRSRYQITICALEQVFSQSEILYLFYETLFEPETIRELCSFVGLEYRPANFERVVNSGGPRKETSADTDRDVRSLFKSTYRFCKRKFGTRLPPGWRVSRKK